MFPRYLEDLVDSFQKLPGVGKKSAERFAFSVLDFSLDDANDFGNRIIDARKKMKKCSICGCLSDSDVCFVCSDSTRNNDIIVVVEDSKEVFLFEKMGNMHCLYHVLGGLISTSDDIGPEDISIDSLLRRIDKNNVREIIFAVKTSVESDITSLYIKKKLEGKNIIISKIASGIPIGAEMDYIDSLTLDIAMKNRKEVL